MQEAKAYWQKPILLGQDASVTDPTEAARQHLADTIMKEGASLKALSRAINKNDAYLQQYIQRGKPRWLSETDRTVLERELPSLNPEKLRPPIPISRPGKRSSGSSGDGHNKPQVYLPPGSKLVDEPGLLHGLALLESLRDSTDWDLVISVLRQFAARS